MINGNLIGFAMVVLSALLIALPGYLLKLPNAATMIGVGAVIIAADVVMRLVNRAKENWLMSDRAGGYLFFIPAWIFGLAVIVVNIVNAFIIKK
ncbi:MAG: hypothetical protein ACKVQJ_08215 [Pyrinomonadaceae bacterium]